jgi:hypothetical protein
VIRIHKLAASAATLGAVLVPAVGVAHHHRVNFASTTIAFHGAVTRVDWKNPHVYFWVRADDESGKQAEWEIETSSTPGLMRRGWTATTLQAGDLVTVRGNPDKNPDIKRLFAASVTKADGTTLILQGEAPNQPAVAQAKATSLEGIWSIIGGPYDRTRAATHMPLTAKGKAAAAAFDVANDPFADCVPPPVPDSLTTPYLHEIVFNDDETITLREEYWEIERTVYLDGRGHPDNGSRTNQGHSIGRWDGDVLVVDTTLFADHGFGNGSGIPSGAQKHIVERYALTDGGTTITIDYVLEDPEYLAEPFRDTRKWRYTPHLELLPNRCDLETARRYIGAD